MFRVKALGLLLALATAGSGRPLNTRWPGLFASLLFGDLRCNALGPTGRIWSLWVAYSRLSPTGFPRLNISPFLFKPLPQPTTFFGF